MVIENDEVSETEMRGTDAAPSTVEDALALADASLLLYDMVAACGCAVLGQTVLLDCCGRELRGEDATGHTLVAQMPNLSQTTLLRQSGAISFDHVTEAMQLALSGCSQIHGQMRTALLEKLAIEMAAGEANGAAPSEPAEPAPANGEAGV